MTIRCAFCHAARASLLTRGPYAGAMACALCYEARATDAEPTGAVPVVLSGPLALARSPLRPFAFEAR